MLHYFNFGNIRKSKTGKSIGEISQPLERESNQSVTESEKTFRSGLFATPVCSRCFGFYFDNIVMSQSQGGIGKIRRLLRRSECFVNLKKRSKKCV